MVRAISEITSAGTPYADNLDDAYSLTLPKRDGSLNATAVTYWLQSQGVEVSGTPVVKRYVGGLSCRTYQLDYPAVSLILRQPMQGEKNLRQTSRMGREYALQKALSPWYSVPSMVSLCEDPKVIGTPFYVMKPIAGVIPRRVWPQSIELDRTEAQSLCRNVVDKLIELHQLDVNAIGCETMRVDEVHIGQQLADLFRKHKRLRLWNTPDFAHVHAWLQDNQPRQEQLCLIHNDWRLDNLVFDPQCPREVIGVLDWEMARLGHPLMDLATMLHFWVEPTDNFLLRRYQWQPTSIDGMLTRREIWNIYIKKSGVDPSDWAFYHVFSLFKLSLQVLALYHRYRAGRRHAHNDYIFFKGSWKIINYFYWKCRIAIYKSRTTEYDYIW
ncbi:phosphotransferase [Agrobacterium vitis]|uniref:Phosphotransferase n=1 Tax=Agrobacterium vitis TaxID=373 RepID=A0A6L6VA15_AGRVI|nr:phosphotransferase family protein [Agrobacterium vitis]MUZ72760.1 phosphotransferase [Agrobacterium vitis]MVA56454.1 phosphotransferase [Agrobacterium vitis]